MTRIAALGQAGSWLDYTAPDEADWRELVEQVGIHPLHVEDCQHVSKMPKLERTEHYLYLLILVPHEEKLAELDLFLFRDRLVTVHLEPSAWIDSLLQVTANGSADHGDIEKEELGAMASPQRLFYSLVDHSVDAFMPVVARHAEEMEEAEQAVWTLNPDALNHLQRLRRLSSSLRQLFARQRDAIVLLMREETNGLLTDEIKPYFHDVSDHLERLEREMEFLHENVDAAVEIYTSLQGQRTNRIMQRLTVLSAIFLPLTWMVGVYGMNFRHMPELQWPWAYPIVMAVMVGVGAGLYVYFRRNDWLS